MIVYKVIVLVTLLFHSTFGKDKPTFIGPGRNVTVALGRNITLTCQIENLQSYTVAWLRVDTQTVLTIGLHVITKNHRVGVVHGAASWTLTLRDVRASDAGQYMCQVNTEPMITQNHLLQVVVPPDIVDSGSHSELLVREGDNVTLRCAASGTPAPTITWRREDSAPMTAAAGLVSKWSGEWLHLTSVERSMNGAFLCIATNGVPPSVSKRIVLRVMCQPKAVVIYKMIGGYIGEQVQLVCQIEANPIPKVYWTHLEKNIINGSKYQATITSTGYKHKSVLKISNISRDDIGSYACHAENSLGTAFDDVILYTLATSSTTTPTTEFSARAIDLRTTVQPYTESEANKLNEETLLRGEEEYVVVLSQHQMQNLDYSPTS